MKKVVVLIFAPTIAVAGTTYDFTVRNPVQPASALVISKHSVQDGKVRADLVENQVLIFKDQAMYVIDEKTRTFNVESHATRAQVRAKLADQARQIRAKAAAEPPDQREKTEQVVSFLEEFQTETYKTVPREYVATTQLEMVDGRECRIWIETENGAKRLELCVVSASTMPGGDEILAGMKSLSEYPAFGSLQALGVQFGYGEWWAGIESLGGVPVLIREFEHGHVVSEITITGVHQEALGQSLFDIPDGYEHKQRGQAHEMPPQGGSAPRVAPTG